MKLTSDLIYEAALDDDAFGELPAIVARASGARSCVLHWRDKSGMAEISAHSGYFSDEQMANYAANFVEHDLWTAAGTRQGFVNKAWRTTDLVTVGEYERSVFYNEWIREMGDDTYFCCGSVMRTHHGDGIIGLHRGSSQGDFSGQALRELNRQVEHLRRMFAIRSRISEASRRGDLLHEIFNAGSRAALMLSREGHVMMANPAGEALLRLERFLRVRAGQVQPAADGDREAFELALASAFDPAERTASECVLRGKVSGAAFVSVMPIASHLARPAALVTVDEPRKPLPRDVVHQHLQKTYRLSPAEADVALRLGEGQTVQEISDARQSAAGTVRIQVKHVLSKMGVRRQADIARLVATSLLVDVP